jgi:hypothetical protein
MTSMEPSEVRAWRDRWREVNAHRMAEVRSMSAKEKARQVSLMMGTKVSARWAQKREAEVAEVRRRWRRLREVYGRPD